MELETRNEWIDYFFSINGLLLIIGLTGLIFLGIRIVQILKDNKQEKLERIEKFENNYQKKHENSTSKEIEKMEKEIEVNKTDNDIYINSPTPLTTQAIVLNKSEYTVSNEELYEKDCTIGEMIVEEEFEEMKENEIVIDVPINENQVTKENDNNEL